MVDPSEHVVGSVVARRGRDTRARDEQVAIVFGDPVLVTKHTDGRRKDLVPKIERREVLGAVQDALVVGVAVIVQTVAITQHCAEAGSELDGQSDVSVVAHVVALGAEREATEQLRGLLRNREAFADFQREPPGEIVLQITREAVGLVPVAVLLEVTTGVSITCGDGRLLERRDILHGRVDLEAEALDLPRRIFGRGVDVVVVEASQSSGDAPRFGAALGSNSGRLDDEASRPKGQHASGTDKLVHTKETFSTLEPEFLELDCSPVVEIGVAAVNTQMPLPEGHMGGCRVQIGTVSPTPLSAVRTYVAWIGQGRVFGNVAIGDDVPYGAGSGQGSARTRYRP